MRACSPAAASTRTSCRASSPPRSAPAQDADGCRAPPRTWTVPSLPRPSRDNPRGVAMMRRKDTVVTPERFASGRTFEGYLAFIGTPENLAREGSSAPRRDQSAAMRAWYEANRLTDAQAAAIRWLASQPGGPAKILVISEEWSSDCRRDVPMLARVAEAGGMELRIFPRDGRRFSASARPSLAEAPDSNAELLAEVLN